MYLIKWPGVGSDGLRKEPTNQRDPEGHAPAFGQQQVPPGPPGALLSPHLLTRLVNQQDWDSALQGGGAQSGARHENRAPHTVQLL